MARPRRRRPAARSGRPRFPFALVLATLIVVVLVAGIFGCLSHQIKGYFTTTPQHGAASSPSPTPLPTTTESAASPPSPSASASAILGPQVAIIIDDCGYSEERCKLFLELPIPITLSILPMTPHGKQTQADALAAGKYVMLHLPMEPESATANPGNGAVTTEMTDDQIHAQVEADVDFLGGVAGANNHMGSKATSDPRVMHDVLDVLHERHMFFIDSETSEQTVGASVARELGVPTAQRNVFLDNKKDLTYVVGQLKQAQEVAKKQGSAIAIGHPNEATIQALAKTIPEMQAAGITFVPAASLVK